MIITKKSPEIESYTWAYDFVEEFSLKFGVNQFSLDEATPEILEFRSDFLLEEMKEFDEAIGKVVEYHKLMVDLQNFGPMSEAAAEVIDALVDISVIALGNIYVFGKYSYRETINAILVCAVESDSYADGSAYLISQMRAKVGEVVQVKKIPIYHGESISALYTFRNAEIFAICARLAEHFGFDFQTHFEEVHKTLMKKEYIGDPNNSSRGSSFDITKPEGWEPPNHEQYFVLDELFAKDKQDSTQQIGGQKE